MQDFYFAKHKMGLLHGIVTFGKQYYLIEAVDRGEILAVYHYDYLKDCGYPFYSARYSLESAGFDRLVQMNELVRGQMRIATTKKAHSKLGQVTAPQRFAHS